MQFLTLASLSISLGLSSAFHIPEGTPNGVYSVYTYANGTEEHVRIGDAVTAPAAQRRSSRVQKRDNFLSGPQCYPSEDNGFPSLDPTNTDNANAALQNQCGGSATIGCGLDFYSIYGCTVAYACNFSESSCPVEGSCTSCASYCSSGTSQQANGYITNGYEGSSGCGEYQPGAIQDEESNVAYGYENYCSNQGSNFCGRGTNGK